MNRRRDVGASSGRVRVFSRRLGLATRLRPLKSSPDVVTLSVFGGVTGFPDATRSNERLCISGDWFSCPPVCASALGSHETRSRDRGRDRGQGRLCSCQSVRCGYAAVLFLTVWGGTALGTQKKDGGSVAFSVVRLQIWLESVTASRSAPRDPLRYSGAAPPNY